jgi:tetratricopeptide (TPR) repeat protein
MMTPKMSSKTTSVLCLSLALLLPAAFFAKGDNHKAPADQAQAEKWITESIQRIYKIDQLNSQYLIYSHEQYHFGIALARIFSIQYGLDSDGWPSISWQDYAHDGRESMKFLSRGRADSFAAALEFLATAAREQVQAQQESSWQQFREQAKSWREVNPKPAMPEAAREHQVLAEYAFKEKDTDKAINEYTAALAVDPCWPEGQFNLATMAGEKRLYAIAVLHMKEYLELVPDAPDAQSAKDSIIVWRDKLQTAVNNDVSASASQSRKTLFAPQK